MRRRICNRLVKIILAIEKVMAYLQKGCDHPADDWNHYDDSSGSHTWCGNCRKEV